MKSVRKSDWLIFGYLFQNTDSILLQKTY